MSLHYFIDAYNLIHSSPVFSLGSLDQKREALMSFLEHRRPTGSVANKITVVFDGRPGQFPPQARGGIQLVFSYEREADDIIKERVDAMSNPSLAVVVTNDRAIQQWVRGAKASVLSCHEFLIKGNEPSNYEKPLKLSPQAAQSVTKELEEFWL